MSEAKKVYFPTYPGLLTKEHHERIGSALWEFLWCIDKTTDEESGRGIVLYGKPVKYSIISNELGISVRTVKEHMKALKRAGYIELDRAPYGVRITVNKSKKFTKRSAENSTSGSAENNTSYGEVLKNAPPEVQEFHKRSAEKCTNNYNHKSLPQINTNTTKNARTEESDGMSSPGPLRGDLPSNGGEISQTSGDAVDLIADRYSNLRTAAEGKKVYPTVEDYEVIKEIANSVPAKEAIELLNQCFRDFERNNRKQPGRKITSFKYCKQYIQDHFSRLKARKEAKHASHQRCSDQHGRSDYEELSL